MIDRSTPGFTVGRRLEKLRFWCSVELAFSDARVPVSRLVGDEGMEPFTK